LKQLARKADCRSCGRGKRATLGAPFCLAATGNRLRTSAESPQPPKKNAVKNIKFAENMDAIPQKIGARNRHCLSVNLFNNGE
jgi:hypothetical protein